MDKIMKVTATWEFEVDISDFDGKFVDIEGLAKDLTQIELESKLQNKELSSEDFDYKVVGNNTTENTLNRQIALTLFNMQLDMDYADTILYGKESIDILEKEITGLKEHDKSLFYVLENIAEKNHNIRILVDGTEED